MKLTINRSKSKSKSLYLQTASLANDKIQCWQVESNVQLHSLQRPTCT